jgi:prepilin-type N-terminal cleavage/methylation domain-containing protein
MTLPPYLWPARRRPAVPRGFSLVELLVVIAIIGVMTGLLLPAVQQSREAARRADCATRLRQIAVATQNYESARGSLPPGAVSRPFAEEPNTPHTFYRWSALAHALPFMEQAPAYAAIDLEAPMYSVSLTLHSRNRAAVAAFIPAFLCPSDRGDRVEPAFGPTNYAACAGSGAEGGTPFDADGLFFVNSHLPLKQAIDGLSHTALVSECVLGEDPPPLTPRSQANPQLVYGFASGIPLADAACLSTSNWNFTEPPSFSWANGEYRSALYNHHGTPNSPTFDCISSRLLGSLAERYSAYGWRAARSQHIGGVNLVLADGSVSFTGDAVDQTVWRALATRAGEDTADN